jgi:hypothetical protein
MTKGLWRCSLERIETIQYINIIPTKLAYFRISAFNSIKLYLIYNPDIQVGGNKCHFSNVCKIKKNTNFFFEPRECIQIGIYSNAIPSLGFG